MRISKKIRNSNSLFLGKYIPTYLPKVDMDLYGEKGYYGPQANNYFEPALVGFKDYGDGFIPSVIKTYKDWSLSEVQSEAKKFIGEYKFILAMNIKNPIYKDQVKLIRDFLDTNYRIK